jgi:hypothetical protein
VKSHWRSVFAVVNGPSDSRSFLHNHAVTAVIHQKTVVAEIILLDLIAWTVFKDQMEFPKAVI